MTVARVVVAILLLLGFGGAVMWQQRQQSRDVASSAPPTTPAPAAVATPQASPVTPPPVAGPDPAVQQAQGQPTDSRPAAPSPATPAPVAADPSPAPEPVSPAFDVVRVEPTGDAVVAGRALPSATVELLRGDAVHDRVVADAGGLFAMTPPALPPGEHQLSLRFTTPDGRKVDARQTVTVVIAPDRATPPIVALAAPGQPTVLLSTPDRVAQSSAPASGSPTSAVSTPPAQVVASAPAADAVPTAPARARQAVSIRTVESDEAGRLYVSGQATAGATVRLYLNETYLASASAAQDGALSFTIQGGVRPGDYKVRLDETDVATGQVRSRAEVAYAVPAIVANVAPAVRAASPDVTVPLPPQAPAAFAPTTATDARPSSPASGQVASSAPSTAASAVAGASSVVVPEVRTTIVSRGDSLWRISRRIYGQGIRYTVIYGANDKQIRDPALIYPGQVFVVPGE